VLPGNVAVGSNADGRLEIFTRGTDNALWHDYQVTAGAADTKPTTEMPQTVLTP
jgi:hypothetical protein